MAQLPDLKIKGRLVFRPGEGDTEHDLGEVEFALAPQPQKPVMRGSFATGGYIAPGSTTITPESPPPYVIQKSVAANAGVIKDIATLPPNVQPAARSLDPMVVHLNRQA